MRAFAFFFFLSCFVLAQETPAQKGDNIAWIQDQIARQYKDFYRDYDIQIKAIHPHFNPNSQIQNVSITRLEFLDPSFSANGELQLFFRFHGKDYQQMLGYEVKAVVIGLFSKIAIKKGQTITPELIYTKPLDLASLNAALLRQKDLNATSAKVQIPPNTLITLYQTEGKILIRKNDSFIATYTEGAISIQTTLIAKSDGRKDDIIEAINPESQKIVRVRVLENGNGEIL